MSNYYNSKRTRNIFDPSSKEPFRLSRSKIDMFLKCPRCFYMDRRLGVGQPPGYPFSLNSAVDALLKREFDSHRSKGIAHPLMRLHNIDAIPFAHERMDEWRDALRRGATHQLEGTTLIITGAVDDLWVNSAGELIVVDYKATSKAEEVSLDADWQIGYKRQMEVYQWLFRKNGFKVSNTGYFVYCNGDSSKELFDNKLEFSIKLIPYIGDDSWVEKTIRDAYGCLLQNDLPASHPECDFCNYRKAILEVEGKLVTKLIMD